MMHLFKKKIQRQTNITKKRSTKDLIKQYFLEPLHKKFALFSPILTDIYYR